MIVTCSNCLTVYEPALVVCPACGEYEHTVAPVVGSGPVQDGEVLFFSDRISVAIRDRRVDIRTTKERCRRTSYGAARAANRRAVRVPARCLPRVVHVTETRRQEYDRLHAESRAMLNAPPTKQATLGEWRAYCEKLGRITARINELDPPNVDLESGCALEWWTDEAKRSAKRNLGDHPALLQEVTAALSVFSTKAELLKRAGHEFAERHKL